MTILVPFDGSELSLAALRRGRDLGPERSVTVVTIVPRNDAAYARERGWLGDDEPFDYGTIVERLRADARAVAPDCEYVVETVGRFAPPGTIASRIKRIARSLEVSIVVIGSENAGRLVSTIASVGDTVAADAYDVYLVRTTDEGGPDG